MTVTVESMVIAAKEQVSTDLGGETAILDLAKGTYYGLDELASRIWDLIRTSRRVSEIRDTILSEYEVDEQTCERDLIHFLDRLEEEGLVVVDGGHVG